MEANFETVDTLSDQYTLDLSANGTMTRFELGTGTNDTAEKPAKN